MLGFMHDTALADQAARRVEVEENRRAREATVDRETAAAEERLRVRVAADLERNRCREEDLAHHACVASFRAERAKEETAWRERRFVVTNTRLHADVQRSFPRATAGEPHEWCAHYEDLRLIQARLAISDLMVFQHVATTLKGSLLVSWKAFVLANRAAVEASTAEDQFL
jgi:hypothetical protein